MAFGALGNLGVGFFLHHDGHIALPKKKLISRGPSPSSMAKLTFILDDGQEIVVPLGERVSVGRENGNDVLVDDPRISARHAEITRDATGVFEVHDLASKLGTFVNGEKSRAAF